MMRVFGCLFFACAVVGCTPSPEPPSQTANPAESIAAGLKVYTANCASCHQIDGYGVSNMQPALVDDPIASGEPTRVIRVVLQGPAAVLPPGGPRYGNVMPPFARLTDQEIADVLTYIRHDFDHGADPIDVAQVQKTRAQYAP